MRPSTTMPSVMRKIFCPEADRSTLTLGAAAGGLPASCANATVAHISAHDETMKNVFISLALPRQVQAPGRPQRPWAFHAAAASSCARVACSRGLSEYAHRLDTCLRDRLW